jgi:hypothetical protein
VGGCDELVRSLYEPYQAWDWPAAAGLLHRDAQLVMPATTVLFAGRDAVIKFQRRYSEPWGDLRVLRALFEAGTPRPPRPR